MYNCTLSKMYCNRLKNKNTIYDVNNNNKKKKNKRITICQHL